MFKAICLTFVFILVVKNNQAYPLHASCKIDWNWPKDSCADVETAIVQQIGRWNNTDCTVGEKCRYALESQSASKLIATHTTPKKLYVDDMTITFQPESSGGCRVMADSRSRLWYAVLDYGTNYCNLENLITGAGLDKRSGYVEKTSNSICTQYSSANCEVY